MDEVVPWLSERKLRSGIVPLACIETYGKHPLAMLCQVPLSLVCYVHLAEPCHITISIHGGCLPGRYQIEAFINFIYPATEVVSSIIFIVDVLLAERCHAFLGLHVQFKKLFGLVVTIS